MFGLFKSYDDEYLELYEYLTQEWGMHSGYAKPFLNAYKKNLGKMYSEALKRMVSAETSSNSAILSLSRIASGGDEYPHSYVLVSQAYQAYLSDLRHGKHVGSSIEMAIWAILLKRLDLTNDIDRVLGKFIETKQEEKFPELLETVFANEAEIDDIWNTKYD
jgi:hypothetical protein